MGLAALGLIGGVASTGLSIYGQKQQAKAVQTAAEYNNTLAQREAANLEAQTTETIRRERVNQSAALSQLRNRFAAAGLRTDTGLAPAMLGEAASRMELSIADAARSAAIDAAQARARGEMGLWEAKQAKKAAKLQMFATGLSGLTSAASQFSQGSYLGMFPRLGS